MTDGRYAAERYQPGFDTAAGAAVEVERPLCRVAEGLRSLLHHFD